MVRITRMIAETTPKTIEHVPLSVRFRNAMVPVKQWEPTRKMSSRENMAPINSYPNLPIISRPASA